MANFSDLRFIPRRIEVIGERDKDVDYVGVANSQLKILEQNLSLGDQKEGFRTVRMNDCVIEAWKSLDLSGVRITITGGGEGQENKLVECFCNCSFTQAYIAKPTDNTPDYPDENRRYDVTACNTKSYYMHYQGCLPSDQIDYEKEAKNYGLSSVNGMPVILFIDNKRPLEDPWKCSSAADVNNVQKTACEQPHVRSDDYPIYRIIPFFTHFEKWKEPPSGVILQKRGRTAHGRKTGTS